MTPILRMLRLLTAQERRRGLLVLASAVAVAVVDTAGVASVMPFLAVLGNPGIVESNRYLAAAFEFGGFADRGDFLFALGIVALVTVLVAAVVRAAGQYVLYRYVNMRRYSLSRRLIDGYLARAYPFFLGRNSADLTKRALSDVDTVVGSCLMPVVVMVASGLVALLLIILLVAVDPLLAAISLAVVGGFYGAFYLGSRLLLQHLGADRSDANRERFTAAAEAFGGIKEIKLLGEEKHFAARFRRPALRFASHKATADAVSLLPRYLLEAVGFGGIVALTLALMVVHGDLGAVLPVLGVYAFAGYRLLPALQGLYFGATRLRFHLPMVEAILADLPVEAEPLPRSAETPLPFTQVICFEAVDFSYPAAPRPVLTRFGLDIRAGETIGLVGPTGAGKTTVVDLLLGLLEPTGGRILVDGTELTAVNRRAWQKNLGYVPQAIHLSDASVAENIAFGVPAENIDRDAVIRAARAARLHDFVTGDLANGYDTVIGERGVRLSGGQRQRIGIARALYRDPPVLVFDEATSALDGATEAAVMEAITALRGAKTMVIIAHRAESLKGCDRVVTVGAQPGPSRATVF